MAKKNTASRIPSTAAAFLTLSASASLFAQGQEREVVLPTVTVKDSAEAASPGYQSGVTRIGKLPQLAKDVPQALTIVPEQLIRDKNAHRLKDALSNVAGLTFNAAEGGRIGDNMNLRGFYSFGDIYLDGMRDVAQIRRDTFNDRQIEVLRGSAAMLFGHGQAGGVINRSSKIPEAFDTGNVEVTYGSHDYKRVTADLNTSEGDMGIRLNAMKTEGGTYRKGVKVDREGAAPSLRLGIDSENEFLLSHYYLDVSDTADYGVPFNSSLHRPVDVPASHAYGTNSDFEASRANITTATYTHRFANSSELRTTLRRGDYQRRLWATAPGYTLATDRIARRLISRGADEQTLTSQTDYTTKFRTGPVGHEFLAGAELLRERSRRCSYVTTGLVFPAAQVSLPRGMLPDYNVSLYDGRSCSLFAGGYAGESRGLYAQDVIEFIPGWKALIGARQDRLDADLTQANGAAGNLSYSEWSYRTGLSWQPSDTSHYYFGMSDSFNPTADLYQFTPTQSRFDPERSRTIELGAKWELLEGDLSLRASLYRASKQWERNTDIESAGVSPLLSMKRHTSGLELEAAGRVNTKWEIFGGFALMRAVIDEQYRGDLLGTFATISGGAYAAGQAVNAARLVYSNRYNPYTVGMTPRNAPSMSFNLWSTYKLEDGWRLGLGVEGKGDRKAYGLGICDSATRNATSGLWTYNACSAPNPNIAPRYYRLDAMLAYEQSSYAVRLNVMNLQDKRYYDSIYENGGFALPGADRTVQISLAYHY